MFQEELEFFKANQGSLVERYSGKTLVLRGSEVVGVYENPLAAYIDAAKSYELGSFMIQPCAPGPGAYTVIISSSELIVA